MHPFCRNALATMDWGGIILNRHLNRDNQSRHTRKTTDIFELASGITTQSYIQCAALCPNNLFEVPQFELDFLRKGRAEVLIQPNGGIILIEQEASKM
jgi:hypothetical protein